MSAFTDHPAKILGVHLHLDIHPSSEYVARYECIANQPPAICQESSGNNRT